MMKEFSRRRFLISGAAFSAGALAPNLLAQQPYAGLRKTLRTAEWPDLTQAEKDILGIRLSDDDAKKLIDYKVNQCVYNNPNVHSTLKNYAIKGKVLDIKRDWEASLVLGRFYAGMMKRAHTDNPNDSQLTVGQVLNAFLDHCSYHILKDGIRWMGAKAQNLSLNDNVILNPKLAIHEKELKSSMPIYETLIGGRIESWPIFQNLPFEPKKIDIWNEDAVETAATKMDRYDLLAIMKKLGAGTSLLKIMPSELACAVPGAITISPAPACPK